MDIWLILAIGSVVAGFVQGLAGFGFGLASLAIWSWALSPEIAVPAVVFGSLIGQIMATGALRHGFEWRRVMPFLAGGVLGVPIGLWLLSNVSPLLFKFGVGILLFAYCSAMLFIARIPHITRGGKFADSLIGWLGGIMSGFGGLPGPIPTLWCTLRDWPAQQKRLVFQTFNLFMHAITLAGLFIHGRITSEVAQTFLVVGPSVLIPTLFGIRLYRHFSDRLFRLLVLCLLAISGFVLIITTAPKVVSLL